MLTYICIIIKALRSFMLIHWDLHTGVCCSGEAWHDQVLKIHEVYIVQRTFTTQKNVRRLRLSEACAVQ